MPRGVAIPELREQLFRAAGRLLARDGPSGLVTRAITTEAGCAKGVLHNHFTDLDGFLAEFVRSCFTEALAGVAELASKAGQATVAENLNDTAAALFDSPVLAAHSIVLFRPSVAARMHQNAGREAPNLMKVALIFTAYLDAEKELGRVLSGVDSRAIALALVATVHHLLMTGHMKAPHARDVVRRVVDVLLAGALPRPESDPTS
jgi:AcrR family transcriptional regulator